MTFTYLIVILGMVYSFRSALASEYVPVFMWGTESVPAVPALTKLSSEAFQDLLVSNLNDDIFTVVFKDETLSPEDLSCSTSTGRSCFSHLKAIRQKGGSLSYLPAVENPTVALEDSIEDNELITKARLTATGLITDQKPENSKYLIVALTDARDDEDRSDLLQRHDHFMAELYKNLRKTYKNVLAIYTANHASWQIPAKQTRRSRELMAEEETKNLTGHLYNASNVVYLYATGASLLTSDAEPIELSFGVIPEIVNQSDSSLVMQLIDATAAVKVTLSFMNSSGYWAMDSVVVSIPKVDKPVSLSYEPIYGVQGFSYHCNDTVFKGEGVKLTISGFQAQPFFEGNTEERFGDSMNCVGFMSIPILSGLFVTFMLAFILSVGVCMMMDIRTMDRFDDPKGKTITINGSE